MKVKIFVEGGGKSHTLRASCQEAFRNILGSFLAGSMPRIIARGSRNEVFDSFKTALHEDDLNFVAMLIDSEDSIADVKKTWDHLLLRDGWAKPANATDEHVLFMTTSMETWVLVGHTNTAPSEATENLDRRFVFARLEAELSNGYSKGRQSFRLLSQVDPAKLASLPSFARVRRILSEKLGA